MSGGVGPTGAGGIEVSAAGAGAEAKAAEDDALLRPGLQAHSPRRIHRFLSFRQLNALATLVVLAASSTVPVADLAFALLSLPYLYLLSSLSFPPLSPSPPPPIFGQRNPLLAAYVALGAVLGLLLPIAYIVDGVLAGDKHGLAAAAPHVFLLAAQVFLEGVTFSHHFSLPIRAFVPVSYNARRLFTLADWLRAEMRKADLAPPRRLLAGRALALANLAFWTFNLLGFLLPIYLPRALMRHYSHSADNNNNNNFGSKEKDKKKL
ncbi:hypothetical protein ACMD2_09775 [Ananas comosus]|uniref:DUF7733 domain-containing protein n=1 Tax=Ananas comosus TaxID=4615 RepID=A0A199VF51_ANACO|nr:hypothetical protein ACMD2_09775 [Ananas comosus]